MSTAPRENQLRPGAAANRWDVRVWRAAAVALACVAGALLAANAVFFAVHAAQMLRYPYPLDYGEGPLLQQANLLRAGVPFWQLYADPAAPPFGVVNYPPVYPVLAALASTLTGDALLAGRLVSLGAALGAVAALWLLMRGMGDGGWGIGRTKNQEPRTGSRGQGSEIRDQEESPTANCQLLTAHRQPPTAFLSSILNLQSSIPLLRVLVAGAFLALPIVREWAVVMRVDMLGVALGLWALVLLQRTTSRAALFGAALLLLASLFTKPSLLAAPGAALVWLLLHDRRRGLLLGVMLAAGGGLLLLLLQWGSGGWFLFHVVTANANQWQYPLAYGFWRDQLRVHGTLVLAAGLCVAAALWRRDGAALRRIVLPLGYAALGLVAALGVGKVGAYLNYFLEWYAGLIWLVGVALPRLAISRNETAAWFGRRGLVRAAFPLLVGLLVCGAFVRFYPMWSQNELKLAGVIETSNPPRLVFGRRGVWQDLRRERALLQIFGQVNAALVRDVRAAGAPIITDVPGVAAQAGQLSRVQMFEHRQLYDVGMWDQRGLLLDMANGRVPLVVLDYLGNWITPELIQMITHRYAQDGSRGTYDVYRPVEPGPRQGTSMRFPNGLTLAGFHLAPTPGFAAYQPGQIALLALDWQRSDAAPLGSFDVAATMQDAAGTVLAQRVEPLLYGAFDPSQWPVGQDVEHMLALEIPASVPPGDYTIFVALRHNTRDLAAPRPLARITVGPRTGQTFGQPAYFVPPPLWQAWQQLQATMPLGQPLMPAVPFANRTEQCFVRGCLQQHGTTVELVPLGETLRLLNLAATPAPAAPMIDERFAAFYASHGGTAVLGSPLSAALIEGDTVVQYTRFARLEQPRAGGPIRFAPLGQAYLRLPEGTPYRWP